MGSNPTVSAIIRQASDLSFFISTLFEFIQRNHLQQSGRLKAELPFIFSRMAD
ncbi:hypothetical protein [Neisseria elongata]|uniref:hypothetical protein n=1 Tax=Neisseria elongata TaxID=495 RepID=UPI00131C4253|nr:hypothetical protein [Neisseria elongata]